MRQMVRADSREAYDTALPAEEIPDSASRPVLMEMALHCSAHRGFDGTSIRDIAGKAVRNSSLVSHNFGCREGFYKEVFRYILKARQSAFGLYSRAPEPVPGDRVEAIRVLDDLIRLLCSDFMTRPEQMDQQDVFSRMLLTKELREPGPRVVSLLRELVAPWIRRFSDRLGILRPCEWRLNEFNSAQAVELLTDFNLRALGVSGTTLTRRDDQ